VDSKLGKLIFLTSRFPYPLNKGDKLRVYYQLQSLSKEFEIHLICINEKEVTQDHLDAVAPFCSSVNSFVLPKYKRVFSLVTSLWKGAPLQVAYFYNVKIDKAIQKHIDLISPDYIHCHLIRTTEYVKTIQDIPKSLDFMDAFASGMEKRQQIESNPLKRLLFRYEKKKLKKYEGETFAYMDRHCIISNQDREAILNPNSKTIAIVKNGVDFEKFYPREEQKQYDLLFMGNMSYPPNIVAVKFLVEQIMPLVLKERPSTTLLVAGVGTPKAIKNYQNKNINIIEHFEDISDSIAYSKIMLAPMLISIGLQNKIIQAMAMKVPCIVSSLSNNPIGAIAGSSIMEADTPSEFSSTILNLLSDSSKKELLAINGYEYVRNQYSWLKQTQALKSLILS
jgi:glycosyltransferase involved in cell wall biosynthesis